MAFKFTIVNHKGEKLRLTQNSAFSVLSVDGLNPPTAEVNIAGNASFDGGTIKNTRLAARTIIATIAINPPIEENRLRLYNFFKTKKNVTCYFENGSRSVFTEGAVSNFNITPFVQKQTAQITIICPNPYFFDRAKSETSFAIVQGMFEFPFSITDEGMTFSELVYNEERVINVGDIETGMVVTFTATGVAKNPIIYHIEKLQSIAINIDLEEGDILTIDTRKGQKSVMLQRGTVITNVINDMTSGSTWIQLESGENTLYYTAAENPENLSVTVGYYNLYEGI